MCLIYYTAKLYGKIKADFFAKGSVFIKKIHYLISALALIAVLILGISLFFCSRDTKLELVNKNGNTIYRIVRAEDVNFDAGVDIKEFKRSLDNLLGASFTLTTDTLEKGETQESVKDVCEILIGATNRPESIEARRALTENDYLIRVVGKKIIITGSSDLTTKKAMDAFLELVSGKNGSALMSNTNILTRIERGAYIIGFANTKKGCVEVYDVSSGKINNDSLVWSFKMTNVSGLKLRHSDKYGDVMLATGGNEYGCMVTYPEGKVVWSTNATATNPHSIELLPNGIIAIASTEGNAIRFFKTDKKSSEISDAEVTLPDAHGVLWDEEKDALWAVGLDVLTAYRVTLNEDGTITVTEDTNLRATIPSTGAHDLAPVYGTDNELWISTFECIYRFNTDTMTFSASYEGSDAIKAKHVKGVGNFDDGTVVYIYPDEKYYSWTSQSIYLLKANATEVDTITSDNGHFYKIRVWDNRYR